MATLASTFATAAAKMTSGVGGVGHAELADGDDRQVGGGGGAGEAEEEEAGGAGAGDGVAAEDGEEGGHGCGSGARSAGNMAAGQISGWNPAGFQC